MTKVHRICDSLENNHRLNNHLNLHNDEKKVCFKLLFCTKTCSDFTNNNLNTNDIIVLNKLPIKLINESGKQFKIFSAHYYHTIITIVLVKFHQALTYFLLSTIYSSGDEPNHLQVGTKYNII